MNTETLKRIGFCVAGLVVIICVIIGILFATQDHRNYARAIRHLDTGDYREARQYISLIVHGTTNPAPFAMGEGTLVFMLSETGREYFRDSAILYDYLRAWSNITHGSYKSAFLTLIRIADFRDSRSVIAEISPMAYEQAVSLFNEISQAADMPDAVEHFLSVEWGAGSIGSNISELQRCIYVFDSVEGFVGSDEFLQKARDLMRQLETIQTDVDTLRTERREQERAQQEAERIQREEEQIAAERQRAAQESIEMAKRHIVGTWEYLGDPPIVQVIGGVRYHPTVLTSGNPMSFFGNGAFQVAFITRRYFFENDLLVIEDGARNLHFAVTMDSADELTLLRVDRVSDFGAPRESVLSRAPYMNFLPSTFARSE